ncbi:alpha/beta hydrolase fold domain-containing protein [Microbacteriaceae bacterium 4G12]
MTRTPRSVRSTLMRSVIILLRYQREFRSAERTLGGAMDRVVRPEPYAPPRFLDRSVRISARRVEGWPVYTVSPKTGRTGRRAVYAHGGAWVHEISFWHWRLLAGLAEATGTEFVVPIHPLVPLGTAGSVVPVFADLTEELVEEVGGENVALLGDSAGGTIALATAMLLLLRDRGVSAPRDVVLIAPALDLSFTDPLIPRIQPTDPWLAVPGARAAAERWRGELPLSHPLVSPIHGSLDGLGRITLFSGTHDILNADALALDRKARDQRHPLDFHQLPNMLHNYPLLPIPEGAAARRTIAAVLTR